MNTAKMKEIESILEKAKIVELLKNPKNREYILSFIQPEINNQIAGLEKDSYNKGIEDFYDCLVKYFERVCNMDISQVRDGWPKNDLIDLKDYAQHAFSHLRSAYRDFKSACCYKNQLGECLRDIACQHKCWKIEEGKPNIAMCGYGVEEEKKPIPENPAPQPLATMVRDLGVLNKFKNKIKMLNKKLKGLK